jgi:phosphatidylglycerophosphate synthase
MPVTSSRRLAARWIGWSPVHVWGLVPAERLRRSLARAGVWDRGPWTGTVPPEPGMVMLLLGDHVYDDSLVEALTRAPGAVLLADGRAVAAHVPRHRAEEVAAAMAAAAPPPDDLPQLSPDDLVAAHRTALRKREPPFVLAVNPASRRAVEDRLFAASYKGVTDAVTKYLWPVPARMVTRWCVDCGLSPNAVTMVSLVLAVAALVLFRDGWLWSGLACAWAMTFLDTVDGKLARVTLTASRLGDALDHGLDLVHPPLWWWAWWAGSGGDAGALAVVLAGYLALRAQEGLFLWRFGIELHVWQRFDSLFRLVTARRNPILVILTLSLAAGAPAVGLHLVAGWTVVSLAVHGVRILQAAQIARHHRMSSWLEV